MTKSTLTEHSKAAEVLESVPPQSDPAYLDRSQPCSENENIDFGYRPKDFDDWKNVYLSIPSFRHTMEAIVDSLTPEQIVCIDRALREPLRV